MAIKQGLEGTEVEALSTRLFGRAGSESGENETPPGSEKIDRSRPPTAEGDKLDVLVTLIEAWERKHFPLDLPDPIDAVKFQMEQAGLSPRDLVPMIGQLNRVYEVLNRKRPLTLRMIWNLHEQLRIPLESLIKPPESSRAA